MKTLVGVGASSGIGIGPAVIIPPRIEVAERRIALDRVAAELSRLDSAVDTADAQLSDATDAVVANGRTAHFDFVELQRSMLRFDLAGETGRVVREQHVGAEWAVRLVVREMRRLFAEASDARIPTGLDDFAAVADRLLRVLLSLPEQRLDAAALQDSIAVAVELSPLDVLQLKRAGVSGIATERGGPTAHAAIVARDLDIPYIFGLPGLLLSASPGTLTCVDGKRGALVIAPDDFTLWEYEGRRERMRIGRSPIGPGTAALATANAVLGDRTWAQVTNRERYAAAGYPGAGPADSSTSPRRAWPCTPSKPRTTVIGQFLRRNRCRSRACPSRRSRS